MKQTEEYVSVSLKLTGEIAKKFIRLKQHRYLKKNSDLAWSLLTPAIEEAVKQIKPVKAAKAQKVA